MKRPMGPGRRLQKGRLVFLVPLSNHFLVPLADPLNPVPISDPFQAEPLPG